MQFTASRYLLSFQSYKGLNIQNQRGIEKGLGTRICDVVLIVTKFLLSSVFNFIGKISTYIISKAEKMDN